MMRRDRDGLKSRLLKVCAELKGVAPRQKPPAPFRACLGDEGPEADYAR